MVDIVTLMEILYEDEIPEMISVQIHAAKSFYDPENSATSPKLSSDTTTLGSLSKTKCALQLSLEHFNPLLPTSSIFQESGNDALDVGQRRCVSSSAGDDRGNRLVRVPLEHLDSFLHFREVLARKEAWLFGARTRLAAAARLPNSSPISSRHAIRHVLVGTIFK